MKPFEKKREMMGRERERRRGDAPQRGRQNKQEHHHWHRQPPIIFPPALPTFHTPNHPPTLQARPAGCSLPRLDLSGRAVDQRRERGSHATGAGTGAPPGGIYSRPALKGRERGHACFPFHSPGTFTRPHMWVLNIYPNTGSNIVGAVNMRQWAPRSRAGWRGFGEGGCRERKNERDRERER